MATNLVVLTGRTGKDAEYRTLENGTAVARLSLATSENYKDRAGQKQGKTQWHNIVCWRGTADFVNSYVPKGSLITVIGKIEYSQYQNKEGATVYSTEIIANNVDLISKGGQNNGNGSNNTGGGYQSDGPTGNYNDEADNDLPF